MTTGNCTRCAVHDLRRLHVAAASDECDHARLRTSRARCEELAQSPRSSGEVDRGLPRSVNIA
jgi:hypothetical protein